MDTCPICKGTGFVDKGDTVQLCSCRFTDVDFQKLLRIPPRFAGADFTNYLPINDSQRSALETCLYYAVNFEPSEGKGLTLLGSTGVGKTHLACALLKEVYTRKHIRGLFFDTREMLSKLRSSFDQPEKHRKILDVLLTVPLLVLDDLGEEMLSDWHRETLTYIITYRYNYLKSTIITTRYTLDASSPNSLAERLSESVANKINQMNLTLHIYK